MTGDGWGSAPRAEFQRALRRHVRWFVGCARMSFGRTLAYRVAVITQAVGLILQVFLLTRIWTEVYAGADSVNGLPLDHLEVYLTLSIVQVWVMETSIGRYIQFRIRMGTVLFDLGRPASFVGQMWGMQSGDTTARVLFMLPALPVAVLAGGIMAPPSASAGLMYAVTLVLGYVINVLIALLIGLVAFWTIEALGTELLVRLITQFFSGAMIPLTFFPDVLRTIADGLPFKFIAYVPVSIYIGQLDGAEMTAQAVLGMAWAVALGGCVWLMWRRAFHRVVVQGG